MKRRLIGFAVALALVISLAIPTFVYAVNPTVTITVTAQVVSITNNQANWAMGTITESSILYFSADNLKDDNYSMITNTSNVAVDVEIQGTTIEGGAYDWTLAAAKGDQVYQLYANSTNSAGAYNIQVKSSSYLDLIANLPAASKYFWSANFTAPTAFHPADDGVQKSGTITLVATKHT